MSKNNTDIDSYKFRHLTTSESDLDQYNALLRYAFQVTEQDLSETGWRDDEIKQSKFPSFSVQTYSAASTARPSSRSLRYTRSI